MKKRSIATKLFVITSLFLILLITLMMYLQLHFFESYYSARKISSLQNKIDALANQTVPDPQTDLTANAEVNDRLLKAMSDLSDDFTIYSAVVHMDDNVRLYSYNNKMVLFVQPVVKEWLSDSNLFNKTVKGGSTLVYETNAMTVGGNNSIAAFRVISERPGSRDVIVAVSSLQPVGEAAGVFRELYPYFLGLAAVTIVLLTFLYSRMISRPLVRLNHAASKMAELDFTARCDVKSRDEIGSLSSTLNFLSHNLDETLRQLHAANRKLQADIEKERQLERMRREFVAGVSHELKTPISLISGYAEGLKENIANDQRRSTYADVIMEETGRMSTIISDLLDLSRLESAKYELKAAPFPLGETMQSIAHKMSIEMEKREIRYELQLPEKETEVEGDRMRIEQVLSNLLSNAIRHTPPQRNIRLTLSLLPGHSEARVDVFNEGGLIAEDDLDAIWDAFYKVETSRNRESGGTGIGLAIVSAILLLHDSRFGVTNHSDGVNFYFTLPLVARR